MKVTYKVYHQIDRFRRLEAAQTVYLLRHWWSENGNLLYGYRDRFNTVCIAKGDIISID